MIINYLSTEYINIYIYLITNKYSMIYKYKDKILPKKFIQYRIIIIFNTSQYYNIARLLQININRH